MPSYVGHVQTHKINYLEIVHAVLRTIHDQADTSSHTWVPVCMLAIVQYVLL